MKREIKFRALYEGVWYYQTLDKMLMTTLAAFRLGKHKTQFTGLKDKNGSGICIYEGDIVSLHGKVIGNRYENEELLKDTTNLLIEGLGTETWRITEEKAMGRGCCYAK